MGRGSESPGLPFMNGRCTACRQIAALDRAHIATRGSGAGWGEDEWVYLCRDCHIDQGKGWMKFVQRWPNMEEVLKAKGWEFIDLFGVWKLRKK